ncbi:MAG: hypothetical protein F6J97_09165 [Leptolyngbya sp. SIO4C1]|nr:hypothetical protein [Leptolyngbya sp. SIO4C1]
MTQTTLFDRVFRDENGNVVIAQPPNPPIITWAVASVLTLLPITDNLQTALSVVSFGALFTWAWQELFDGVNYFRRSLGLIVLLGAIASKLQW